MARSWLWLAAGIAAYDAWLTSIGHPTLSAEFAAAAREHPAAVTAVTAYTLAHLYGILPIQTDAIRGFGALHRSALCLIRQRTTGP